MSLISDTYRQRKGGSQPSTTKKTNKVPRATGVFAAEDVERDKELVIFDLTNKFGPCKGISRLERWERAERLGLQPPPHVREIILQADPEDREELNQSTWENRNI